MDDDESQRPFFKAFDWGTKTERITRAIQSYFRNDGEPVSGAAYGTPPRIVDSEVSSHHRPAVVLRLVPDIMTPHAYAKMQIYLRIGTALVLWALSTRVLVPFFEDLMRTLDLSERDPAFWGRAAITLLVGMCMYAGIQKKGGPWWKSRKTKVSVLMLGIGLGIFGSRVNKGVSAERRAREAAITKAKEELLQAEAELTSISQQNAREEEAAKAATRAKAHEMIDTANAKFAEGVRDRLWRVRRQAMDLMKTAQALLNPPKEKAKPNVQAAKSAVQRAQERLKELPRPEDINLGEIARDVAGIAWFEILMSEAMAVMAAAWGAWATSPLCAPWAVAPPPVRPRRRESSASKPEEDDHQDAPEAIHEPRALIQTASVPSLIHPTLQDVPFDQLDHETLEGLDRRNGTWRNWPLTTPKRRYVKGLGWILWPRLKVRDSQRAVFAGSRRALQMVA